MKAIEIKMRKHEDQDKEEKYANKETQKEY